MQIGIYARISKEKEEIDRSIDDQIKSGIELAKKLHIDFEVYREKDGTSGSLPIDKRPELERLVNDIVEGKISKIYAFDQSRLERSEETRYILKRLFKENKVEVYFNSGLQGQSLEGDLAGDIISRVNQYYLEITAKKIKSVLRRNAEEGRKFSFIPYGYKEGEDKKLIIDEQEAELVKRIFALSLQGVGVERIAAILNSENIPTIYNKHTGTYKVVNKYTGEVTIKEKKKTKWKGGTVNGMLSNTIYKGERRWGNTTYSAPAIFEEWYFDQVNDNRKNNSNNRGRVVTHSYLLKGLLRCDKCGANFYGKTRVAELGKKPRDNYYTCSSKRRGEENCGNRSLNIDALDSLIWFHMIFGGKMKQLLKAYYSESEISIKIKNKEESLKVLNAKIEQIDKKKENVINAIGEGIITKDEAKVNIEKMRSEKASLVAESMVVENELESLLESAGNKKENLEVFSKLKGSTIDEKRELIRRFVRNIRINDEPDGTSRVIIEFNFPDMAEIEYLISPNRKTAVELNDKKEATSYVRLDKWVKNFNN